MILPDDDEVSLLSEDEVLSRLAGFGVRSESSGAVTVDGGRFVRDRGQFSV